MKLLTLLVIGSIILMASGCCSHKILTIKTSTSEKKLVPHIVPVEDKEQSNILLAEVNEYRIGTSRVNKEG